MQHDEKHNITVQTKCSLFLTSLVPNYRLVSAPQHNCLGRSPLLSPDIFCKDCKSQQSPSMLCIVPLQVSAAPGMLVSSSGRQSPMRTYGREDTVAEAGVNRALLGWWCSGGSGYIAAVSLSLLPFAWNSSEHSFFLIYMHREGRAEPCRSPCKKTRKYVDP